MSDLRWITQEEGRDLGKFKASASIAKRYIRAWSLCLGGDKKQ